MAAEDELMLPQVPEAKTDDPEDVSWALSTAEAMWARGDHLEGIKWVRRAAEAASEAEVDERALELAKAAADLASLISRRSRAAAAEVQHGAPPAPASSAPAKPGRAASNNPPSAPSTARSAAAPSVRPQPMSSVPPAPGRPPPPAAPSSAPSRQSGAPRARSVPPAPIPLPSKASSQPPGAPGSPGGPSAPRAPAAAASSRPQGPAPGKGILSNRTADKPEKKGRRRSRENLDAEARAAGLVAPASGPTLDAAPLPADTTELAAAIESPLDRTRVGPAPYDSDATMVGTVDDLVARDAARAGRTAAEWDASPTQNLAGAGLEEPAPEDRERKTHVGAAPAPRPPSPTLHDPQIQTSQAIRVVVWRDANGVHIAPAGTVVSALTIDAVLVALEPTADLTAWLSHRER